MPYKKHYIDLDKNKKEYLMDITALTLELNEIDIKSIEINADAHNCFLLVNGKTFAFFSPKVKDDTLRDVSEFHRNSWNYKKYEPNDIENNIHTLEKFWKIQLDFLLNARSVHLTNYFITHSESFIEGDSLKIKYNFIRTHEKEGLIHQFFKDAFKCSTSYDGVIVRKGSYLNRNEFEVQMSNGEYKFWKFKTIEDYTRFYKKEMSDKFKAFCSKFDINCQMKFNDIKTTSQAEWLKYTLTINRFLETEQT